MEYNDQVAAIKNAFSVCETPGERRQIFLTYTMDMDYSRGAICQALKEMGIQDDMTLKERR